MDIIDAIYSRRSVREYDSFRQVPKDVLERMLEAAIQAPSAGNRQPWRFLIAKSKELRSRLSKAAHGQQHLFDAPVVIIVAIDTETALQAYGNRGLHLYAIQDTAAAIENMMLFAVSEGLGTCWVGAFDEDMVAETIGTGSDLRIVALLTVGYPAGEEYKPVRKSHQDFTVNLD